MTIGMDRLFRLMANDDFNAWCSYLKEGTFSKEFIHKMEQFTFPAQLACIRRAKENDLSQEAFDLLLKYRFNHKQMHKIIDGYLHCLDQWQIEFYAKPEYDSDQMDVIHGAFCEGFSKEKIETFSKPNFESTRMLKIRQAYTINLPDELMQIILNPNTSSIQVEHIVNSFCDGLTTEQIKTLIDYIFSHEQMLTIRKAYACALPHDLMQIILNPQMPEYQTEEIINAFNDGLTIDQIKSLFSIVLSHDHLIQLRKHYIEVNKINILKKFV